MRSLDPTCVRHIQTYIINSHNVWLPVLWRVLCCTPRRISPQARQMYAQPARQRAERTLELAVALDLAEGDELPCNTGKPARSRSRWNMPPRVIVSGMDISRMGCVWHPGRHSPRCVLRSVASTVSSLKNRGLPRARNQTIAVVNRLRWCRWCAGAPRPAPPARYRYRRAPSIRCGGSRCAGHELRAPQVGATGISCSARGRAGRVSRGSRSRSPAPSQAPCCGCASTSRARR